MDMKFAFLASTIVVPWIDGAEGHLRLDSLLHWHSDSVVLELELSNEGQSNLCILKADVFTREMWPDYRIYSDFMMVRDGNDEDIKFSGPTTGGEVRPELVEIAPGTSLTFSYKLTDYYHPIGSEVSTRNFISYADCHDLHDEAVQLVPMDMIVADIRYGDYQMVQNYYEDYIQNGGRYADTGWKKHEKPSKK